MVNQSKAQDPRFWKKWRASGAVGNADSAYLKSVLSQPTEEYVHPSKNSLELPLRIYKGCGMNAVSPSCEEVVTESISIKEVPFMVGKVLVEQAQLIRKGKSVPFVLIPGFVKSHGQSEYGFKTTQVVPIKDKKVRENLAALVKEDSTGPINFW
jgi:hypothetical protein